MLRRPVEICAKYAQGSMSPRPDMHGRINSRAARDCRNCDLSGSGVKLAKQVGFERRVIGLATGVSHLHIAALPIDRGVAKKGATHDVSRDAAQALTDRHAVAGTHL
jgi:hypothetical protein